MKIAHIPRLMRLMTIANAAAIILVFHGLTISAEYKLTPERPLNVGGGSSGGATLNAALVGERIKVNVRFEASGLDMEIFNPFFNQLSVMPAELAVFDSNKQYLGDLLQRNVGSFRGPTADEWINIRGGGSVGVTFDTDTTLHFKPLRPGKYYLQLIYKGIFLSQSPARNGIIAPEAFHRWMVEYDKPDLFRSNVVELELPARAKSRSD